MVASALLLLCCAQLPPGPILARFQKKLPEGWARLQIVDHGESVGLRAWFLPGEDLSLEADRPLIQVHRVTVRQGNREMRWYGRPFETPLLSRTGASDAE